MNNAFKGILKTKSGPSPRAELQPFALIRHDSKTQPFWPCNWWGIGYWCFGWRGVWCVIIHHLCVCVFMCLCVCVFVCLCVCVLDDFSKCGWSFQSGVFKIFNFQMGGVTQPEFLFPVKVSKGLKNHDVLSFLHIPVRPFLRMLIFFVCQYRAAHYPPQPVVLA